MHKPRPERSFIYIGLVLLGLMLLGSGGCSKHDTFTRQRGGTPMPASDISTSLNAPDSLLAKVGQGALLASRFASLEEFKTVVRVEYAPHHSSPASPRFGNSCVRLTHRCQGREVSAVLEPGITQGDIMDISKGRILDKIPLIASAPYAIIERKALRQVYTLARRRPQIFGAEDPAYYDLASAAVDKIHTTGRAILTPADTGEKGYINTFNHITAQALITTLFSEELAEFIADAHERLYMPELTSGNFTPEQFADPDNYPVDNYVDMVNNEWGQLIGHQLRKKFGITPATSWTPELLANYLNELQAYYCWAFQIEMEPFRAREELVRKFADKINKVMRGIVA